MKRQKTNQLNETTTCLYINNLHYMENISNSIYDLTIINDHLYIPDFRNNKLIVFGLLKYNVISTFDVPMPHSIAVDKNGNIFICTYRENSIAIIEKNSSRYVKSIHLDYPISIAIQDNNILIANWGEGDTGNLIISRDNFNSFEPFTEKMFYSKPHAVRINDNFEITVVYRNPSAIAVYDIKGNILKHRTYSGDFDPLSIIEYKSHYLVPNYVNGRIHILDSSLNNLNDFLAGGHLPTNLTIYNNQLFICEEMANRILSIKLESIEKLLN